MVVDRRDACVVELGGCPNLVTKGRCEARVRDDVWTQDLERNRVRVHGVVRLKYGGHSASPKDLSQGEWSNGGAFLHADQFYRGCDLPHKPEHSKQAPVSGLVLASRHGELDVTVKPWTRLPSDSHASQSRDGLVSAPGA